MASSCIQCRRYILPGEPRVERALTKTVTVAGRTMPVNYTDYLHEECPK